MTKITQFTRNMLSMLPKEVPYIDFTNLPHTEEKLLTQMVSIDQSMDQHDLLLYTQHHVLPLDITKITSQEFEKILKKFHSIAAQSITIVTFYSPPAGNYTKEVMLYYLETNIPGKKYVQTGIYVEKNYLLLKEQYGTALADDYKKFTKKLAARVLAWEVRKAEAEGRSGTMTVNLHNSEAYPQIILKESLHRDRTYVAFCKLCRVGKLPDEIPKAMAALCRILVRKIAKKVNPFECAAYVLYQMVIVIQPFTRTVLTAQHFANCIIMGMGEYPFVIQSLAQEHDFFMALENCTDADLTPLTKFLTCASAQVKSAETNSLLFPDGKQFYPKVVLVEIEDFVSYVERSAYHLGPLDPALEITISSLIDTMNNTSRKSKEYAHAREQLFRLMPQTVDSKFCLSKARALENVSTPLSNYYFLRGNKFHQSEKEEKQEKEKKDEKTDSFDKKAPDTVVTFNYENFLPLKTLTVPALPEEWTTKLNSATLSHQWRVEHLRNLTLREEKTAGDKDDFEEDTDAELQESFCHLLEP